MSGGGQLGDRHVMGQALFTVWVCAMGPPEASKEALVVVHIHAHMDACSDNDENYKTVVRTMMRTTKSRDALYLLFLSAACPFISPLG